MIPRLGDGNLHRPLLQRYYVCLENDSPSRGRKRDGKTIAAILAIAV